MINLLTQRIGKVHKKNQFLYDHILKLQNALSKTESLPVSKPVFLDFADNKSFMYSGKRADFDRKSFEVDDLDELSLLRLKKIKKKSPNELIKTEDFLFLGKHPSMNNWEIQEIAPIIRKQTNSLKKVKKSPSLLIQSQKLEFFFPVQTPKIQKNQEKKEETMSIQNIIDFLRGFRSPYQHSLNTNDFLKEFEKVYSFLINIYKSINPKSKIIKKNNLFTCSTLPKKESILDPLQNSNILFEFASSAPLTTHTIAIILILILMNFKHQIPESSSKIFKLITLLRNTSDNLTSSPFLRLINLMFKKFCQEIEQKDVDQVSSKISNSFGYLNKLFCQLLHFTESEIISNNSSRMNLGGFYPSKITQSATFQGACAYYLKRNQTEASKCLFFCDVRDLLTSVRLVCGLPCMVNLNHKHVGILRGYISGNKFRSSEQQKVFMYMARDIPLPDAK